ncbi:unnamed protein product, partial [Timema podura]|nr:unnamed protein product [Timema podura]
MKACLQVLVRYVHEGAANQIQVVAYSQVEELASRKEALPDGWAVGPGGEPTTDPVVTLQSKRMYPLGGRLGGHKGYGLSLMVECLCGILSDSLYGSYIRPWDSLECKAQLGQCFMIINPVFFAPGYQQRLSCLLTTLRRTTPV